MLGHVGKDLPILAGAMRNFGESRALLGEGSHLASIRDRSRIAQAPLYLGEAIRWNNMVSFGFLVLAAFFSFHKWS